MSVLEQYPNIDNAAKADIEELNRRIQAFRAGKEDEERFKLYRLTRGVYGQRQFGVQMFRTKIPYGYLRAEQLACIADVSEKYTNGRLHITTRQNIQMHYVKLEDSPAIWAELAAVGVTAREACGNTVRNLTASPTAGIDPDEPFDISPYAQSVFEYFLRNPICQEMGRKIKPSFSSSEKDTAFAYFHDFGFIPKIKEINGVATRGFALHLGGGLGAVSMAAHEVYDFLATDKIIPFMEACIRVFDRYGEREKRMKARMKFLIKKLGLDTFLELVEIEQKGLVNQSVAIDPNNGPKTAIPTKKEYPAFEPADQADYSLWKQTNVIAQKQTGWYAVQLRIPLGNLTADEARGLADIVGKYAADDIRLTVNQGAMLRFVQPEALPHLYEALKDYGLHLAGFDTIADITACPGTDTCALGVTNSTGLAQALEELLWQDYRDEITALDFKIKISGCMNSCGQHMAANIGFHGSSIKHNNHVLPAMQLVLGGGPDPNGKGFIAEKIIKLPTKRIPEAVKLVLNDYQDHGGDLYYNDYVAEKGRRYFYGLLKPLANLETITEADYRDWGQEENYHQAIGVGECAGAMLDVIATILGDAEDKVQAAQDKAKLSEWPAAVYFAYQAQVIAAKALLLSSDVKCNTHRKILDDFQEHYVDSKIWPRQVDFPQLVLSMNEHLPDADFGPKYLVQAEQVVATAIELRRQQLLAAQGIDKEVVSDYYKA